MNEWMNKRVRPRPPGPPNWRPPRKTLLSLPPDASPRLMAKMAVETTTSRVESGRAAATAAQWRKIITNIIYFPFCLQTSYSSHQSFATATATATAQEQERQQQQPTIDHDQAWTLAETGIGIEYGYEYTGTFARDVYFCELDSFWRGCGCGWACGREGKAPGLMFAGCSGLAPNQLTDDFWRLSAINDAIPLAQCWKITAAAGENGTAECWLMTWQQPAPHSPARLPSPVAFKSLIPMTKTPHTHPITQPE